MELREKAGSGDMLTVEKKLERQKAKAEQRLKQMESATESQKSVFDFINSKLTNNTTQGSKGTSLILHDVRVQWVDYCIFC